MALDLNVDSSASSARVAMQTGRVPQGPLAPLRTGPTPSWSETSCPQRSTGCPVSIWSHAGPSKSLYEEAWARGKRPESRSRSPGDRDDVMDGGPSWSTVDGGASMGSLSTLTAG